MKNGFVQISFREENLVTVICLGAVRDSRPAVHMYFNIIQQSLEEVAVIKRKKKKKDVVAAFQLVGLLVFAVLIHTPLKVNKTNY